MPSFEGIAYPLAALFIIVATIAFFGAPLLWLFTSSLDPRASPIFELPEDPALDNYLGLGESVAGVSPLRWVLNSIVLSVGVATLTTVVSLLASYTLTRHSFRGQGAMITMMVVFRLIPSIIVALPVMVLMSRVGGLNSMLSVILVITALILPFAIMMMEGYLRTIPPEYEEAALIDGLSKPEAFARVTLPLALPGIATVWLLAFVVAWSEFVIPLLLLNDPSKYPASVGLWFFFGEYGTVDYGRLSAFSIIYSIPAVIIFIAIQRHLTRGLAALATR